MQRVRKCAVSKNVDAKVTPSVSTEMYPVAGHPAAPSWHRRRPRAMAGMPDKNECAGLVLFKLRRN
jgi:hypothetical protein